MANPCVEGKGYRTAELQRSGRDCIPSAIERVLRGDGSEVCKIKYHQEDVEYLVEVL